jgi:hypothetical protein
MPRTIAEMSASRGDQADRSILLTGGLGSAMMADSERIWRAMMIDRRRRMTDTDHEALGLRIVPLT